MQQHFSAASCCLLAAAIKYTAHRYSITEVDVKCLSSFAKTDGVLLLLSVNSLLFGRTIILLYDLVL